MSASLAILRDRVTTLPAALASACAAALPSDWSRLLGMQRYVVTGGGLSEGPARVLVALLLRAGRCARFVPQSAFTGARLGDADEGLILFSQGLAPNARLPLGVGIEGGAVTLAFGAALLVTAVSPSDRGVGSIARRLAEAGGLVWTLPPVSEDGLLLRVVGPAVALVAAIRIAEALAPGRVLDGAGADALDRVSRVVAERLREPGLELFGSARRPIALVAGAALVELAMPLRWKLLEGLRVPDPPVWDLLQIAHGPLQAFYDEAITLVALRPAAADPAEDALLERLARVLRPVEQHRLLTLRATLPGPAALVELDAVLDAALLTTLTRHPLALDDWPGRGLDGPLYDLDPALLAREGR